eukprot:TRINITY_DN39343_c0_g1_i3.p1 TRINITY_DN39343_c0_g1~~TRINITY_DN39343_c0_g1_i3.p1  ORF type:complete len:485 (-),score=152.20 TRINITY_DN39343_c0_g1_i3:177-1586(-)
MEVRIDAIEGQAQPPSDLFISLRIGDMQKQSRFENARTFRFPETVEGKGGFGRVELFKRVGHTTLGLDGFFNGGAQDLAVPVCFGDSYDQSSYDLRIAVTSKNPAEQQKAKVSEKKTRAKARMDAAQKYLHEHRLEELLAETMRQVINDKPEDPRCYIAEKIMQMSSPGNAEKAVAPPPAVPNSVKVKEEEVTTSAPKAVAPPPAVPVSTKKKEAPPFTDFGTYYTSHFAALPLDNLYAKFNSKAKASAPVKEKEASPAPPSTSTSTHLLPSVGTWLQKAPVNKASTGPAVVTAASQPVKASQPAPSPLLKMESFGEYYTTHCAGLSPASMPSLNGLYGKFAKKDTAAPPPLLKEKPKQETLQEEMPPAKAAAPSTTPAFCFKPSVASWYQRLPSMPAVHSAPPVSPSSKPHPPFADLVPELLNGHLGAEAIEIIDQEEVVELVEAFKAELDKKDEEIRELKQKLGLPS